MHWIYWLKIGNYQATCIHHHHQEKKKKLSLMILWHLICGKEWNYRFGLCFFSSIPWKQNNYIQRKRKKQEKKDERRRVWETKIVMPIGIHSQAQKFDAKAMIDRGKFKIKHFFVSSFIWCTHSLTHNNSQFGTTSTRRLEISFHTEYDELVRQIEMKKMQSKYCTHTHIYINIRTHRTIYASSAFMRWREWCVRTFVCEMRNRMNVLSNRLRSVLIRFGIRK